MYKESLLYINILTYYYHFSFIIDTRINLPNKFLIYKYWKVIQYDKSEFSFDC